MVTSRACGRVLPAMRCRWPSGSALHSVSLAGDRIGVMVDGGWCFMFREEWENFLTLN